MVKFTIIVPVFQTPEILRLFLDSLKQTLTQDTTIIFVNDGSGYEVQIMLETFEREAASISCPVRIMVLENPVSLGSVRSINAALALIDPACEYVVFLDSDTILQGPWQEELLASFTAEDIGAVGGLLLYPQSGGIQCCGLTYCGNTGKHLYLNASPDSLNETPFEVQATVFAFCCIRQAVIKQVGVLDEHFFNGYEDLDYQFRLRKLGYRILTIPSIRHYHWERSNGNHREFNRKSNLGRFWMKHGAYVKDDLVDFTQRRLERLALSPHSYRAFDFCEERDAATRVKAWLNTYQAIRIDSWQDLSYACCSRDTVWLPPVLDSGQPMSLQPLLFLCDQMVQLLDNQYWWSIRGRRGGEDLIVDLSGNALLFSQLQKSFWPGRKIR